MDEKQAINSLKQHDPAGLTWLVEQNQVKALRTAYLITREVARAEDVVQATFLDLPDIIRSYDETRPFEPWFMRVIVHRALRSLSREKRLVAFPENVETDGWIEAWIDHVPGPEEEIDQTELREFIWSKLQLLRPEQRAALVMRYYLQMNEAEMSEFATAPLGTIKWRLSAARRRLRKIFTADPRKDEE